MPGPHFNSKRLKNARNVRAEFAPGSVPRVGAPGFRLRLLPRTVEKNCLCRVVVEAGEAGEAGEVVGWNDFATLLGTTDSEFGHKVVISDTGKIIAIVSNEPASAGKLWIYRLNTNGTTYTLDHSIDGSATEQICAAGTPASMSAIDVSNDGNTIVFGVKNIATPTLSKINVLKYASGTWSIDSTIGGLGDSYINCCINGDGNRVGISSPFSGTQSNIYVYSLSTGSNAVLGSVIDLTTYGPTYSGFNLAMNKTGDHLYISAYNGKSFVYKYTTNWAIKGSVLSNDTANSRFGEYGDINDSGNRLVVTAGGLGKLFIYDYTTDWTLSKTIANPDTTGLFSKYGASINGAGDKIVTSNYTGSSNNKGYIISYKLDGGDWVVDMDKKYGNDNDYLGMSVDISKTGDFIVAASYYANSSDGKVTVYKL